MDLIPVTLCVTPVKRKEKIFYNSDKTICIPVHGESSEGLSPLNKHKSILLFFPPEEEEPNQFVSGTWLRKSAIQITNIKIELNTSCMRGHRGWKGKALSYIYSAPDITSTSPSVS